MSDLSLADYFSYRWEPLFIFFVALIKSTINDFIFFFQIVHSIIINSVVFWFISSNTKNKFTAVFLYFLFLYVLVNMEIAREALAVSVFLVSVKFLQNKKIRCLLFIGNYSIPFPLWCCDIVCFSFNIRYKDYAKTHFLAVCSCCRNHYKYRLYHCCGFFFRSPSNYIYKVG